MTRCFGFLGFLAACAGCGGSIPDAIVIADTCTSPSGVSVQVEAGMQASCASLATTVDVFRSEYESKWGAVDLTGWTVRIRMTAQRDGDLGLTMHSAKTVDVAVDAIVSLPHELRHVQLGPSSDGHAGWCTDFEPWEASVIGLDESAYLGCS
jgi:hypothetical protein